MVGYSIEYPIGWIAKGGKGGFMCGKKGGFENAEWTIFLVETSNAERIKTLLDEKLTEDEKEIKKLITVDGINGFHLVITSKIKSDEYRETVILKTELVWYQIQSSGIKDENFKLFYESIKLTK